MSGFWRHQFLFLTLLAFIVLSEGSRLPKGYWEQMLPKKLPSPSSSPSGGTNSVFATSSTASKIDNLPSSDGKGQHQLMWHNILENSSVPAYEVLAKKCYKTKISVFNACATRNTP
ncbi:hypothetical protein CR513_49037, partial [Mucuna pruriens]